MAIHTDPNAIAFPALAINIFGSGDIAPQQIERIEPQRLTLEAMENGVYTFM